MQPASRDLQLTRELRGEVLPRVDRLDELGLRGDGAIQGAACPPRLRLQRDHLIALRCQRGVRHLQRRQGGAVLLDHSAVALRQHGDCLIGAHDGVEIRQVQQQAQVSGASQLVQLTQARVHLWSLRAGRTLELDAPGFDLGQCVRRLLEVALDLVELLGLHPTFELEPPQIAEQRSLARGQLSGFPLQRLNAFVRAARQGFELGAVLD